MVRNLSITDIKKCLMLPNSISFSHCAVRIQQVANFESILNLGRDLWTNYLEEDTWASLSENPTLDNNELELISLLWRRGFSGKKSQIVLMKVISSSKTHSAWSFVFSFAFFQLLHFLSISWTYFLFIWSFTLQAWLWKPVTFASLQIQNEHS